MTDNTPGETTLDCGMTIEQVADYLDAARLPVNTHIEACPDCLNAIEALERSGRLARELIDDDASRLPPPAKGWFQHIFTAIQQELRAGRRLPLSHPDPLVRITVTEGAVKALLRNSGDTVDGVFLSRVDIVGDAETPAAPVDIDLTVSVRYGAVIPQAADELRAVTQKALSTHIDLNVAAVNINVEDIHPDARERS